MFKVAKLALETEEILLLVDTLLLESLVFDSPFEVIPEPPVDMTA
jgi:hypothetical protein